MPGAPVTSGLSAKRGSSVASGITSVCWDRIACAQKDTSREVSRTSSPKQLLNHWRFSSTSETRAIGTSKIRLASRVIRSKRSSSGVSSNCRLRSFASREASSAGRGALDMRSRLPECRGRCGCRSEHAASVSMRAGTLSHIVVHSPRSRNGAAGETLAGFAPIRAPGNPPLPSRSVPSRFRNTSEKPSNVTRRAPRGSAWRGPNTAL